MNIMIRPASLSVSRSTAFFSSTLRAYILELHCEAIRCLRIPSFSLPMVLTPLAFYLVFGVALRAVWGHIAAPRYVLATYIVFGLMPPGLFGLGMVVALDREHGLLDLKRAVPMPSGAYLTSKLAMAMIFAAIMTALMILVAVTVGHVSLPTSRWIGLFVLSLFGVLPFCALGLFVGALVKGQAAPAIMNLIFMPMSFLSGLWMPLFLLPHGFSLLALAMPPYHLAALALAVVGSAPASRTALHIAFLIATTVLCSAGASLGLRRRG